MTYTSETTQRVTATLAAIDAHYPVKAVGALLTTTNPKLVKGAEERGYLAAVLHLAPASMSGANVCPWSSTDCAAGCLNTSGRGGIGLDASGWNGIQASRIRRTAAMILDPDMFSARLRREITAHARNAERHGLTPSLRLNGTSDIAWHRKFPEVVAHAIAEGCVLYDYTKRPTPDAAEHGIDVTYSYPGGQGEAARRYLDAGYRVAVVFATRKGAPLPATWTAPWGGVYNVIDGDAHDLRFTDPGGVIVGLRAKGKMRGTKGTLHGFLQQP
jgi:hypothetical protein